MPEIFDGKTLATAIETDLAERAARLSRPPRLGIVFAGGDPASEIYARAKISAADRVGVKAKIFPTEPEPGAISAAIADAKKWADGLICQLPLPGAAAEKTDEILAKIPPEKDLDGFLAGSPFAPPVGSAVLAALREAPPGWENRPIGLVGFGRTGGRAIARFFDEFLENDEKPELWIADLDDPFSPGELAGCGVVIGATGAAGAIPDGDLPEKFWAIQVGLRRGPDGEILGDFDEKSLARAIWATPARGGIGPLTVAFLLENCVHAAESFR